MTFDDQPIGGSKPPASFDDQPLGGKSSNNPDPYADGEEAPIKRGAYNLDNLDELDAFGTGGGFGNPPPIKKKPAPVKKKIPVEEEKKLDGGDVEMKDDFKPPEVKKPAPKKPELGNKPAAAAKSTTTVSSAKGPSGPQIQEEDVGAGLSKEEAEAKVQETFPGEIVEKFDL